MEVPFIVSEPGHALHGDPGAIANGIIESDWNMFSAVRFEDRLDGYLCDCQVFQPPGLTALEDLEQSVQFAVEKKAALYLSFHVNKFSDPAVSGFRSYTYSGIGTSDAGRIKAVQGAIHQAAAAYCVANGMKDGGQHQGNYFVLRECYARAKIKAILFEIGFMSNPGDAAKLKDLMFLDKLINEIAWGTVQALELQPRGTGKDCDNCPELRKAEERFRVAKEVLSDFARKSAPYMDM